MSALIYEYINRIRYCFPKADVVYCSQYCLKPWTLINNTGFTINLETYECRVAMGWLGLSGQWQINPNLAIVGNGRLQT